MNVQPRPWKPPVDPAEAAEAASRWETLRAQRDAEWAAGAPLRRALIAAAGELRDVDAAVDCRCGCHPRVSELHDGGATCGCQLTDDERAEAQRRLLDTLAELHDSFEPRARDDEAAAVARAGELDVELRSYGGLAPLVCRGVVDGHGFFLRERHGSWQVVVTAHPDGHDPWGDGHEDDQLIASGDESALLDHDGRVDPGLVVTAAVVAVRRWLLADCPHPDVTGRDDTNFCPRCGTAVSARFGATQAPRLT